MYIRFTACEDVEHCGSTYGAGKVSEAVPLDTSLIDLSRGGSIIIHSPYYQEPGAEPPDGSVAVVYRGEHSMDVTPAGVFFRMIPEYVSIHGIEHIRGRIGFDYTLLEFCNSSGAYIKHNTTMSSWEKISDILPAFPRILIIRDEGAGDVLLSLPVVKEIKKRCPSAYIEYATRPALMDGLRWAPYIDNVLSVHEVDLSYSAPWDLVINWSRGLEDYRIPRNRLHRMDAIAAHVGLEIVDRTIDYQIWPGVMAWAAAELRRASGGRRTLPEDRIGIVIKAAERIRTWDIWLMPELVEELKKVFPDKEIILIDGQDFPDVPGALNLAGRTPTFEHAAALCALCGLVISPDTGLAHATGALEIPTLVVAGGDVPPDRRYSYYPTHEWIYSAGRVPCAPCWGCQSEWIPSSEKDMPAGGENCLHADGVPCMSVITPAEIAELAGRMMS